MRQKVKSKKVHTLIINDSIKKKSKNVQKLFQSIQISILPTMCVCGLWNFLISVN